MRGDVARAERSFAVRAAAGGWRRAGAIDDATLRAIVAAYPDDRMRLGLGFRILACLAALAGGGAVAGLAASLFARGGTGTLFALVLTLAFATATELQTGRLRRAQAGAEYATAMLAAIWAALAWVSLFSRVSVGEGAIGMGVVFAVGAWRWGYALFAAAAAVCLLVACAGGSLGRAAWAASGVVALPLVLRMARSARWPPAHRRCLVAAASVFLAGGYLATNVYSFDHRWIEGLEDGGRVAAGTWGRVVAIAGTALLPPILLDLGVRFRSRTLLIAGAVFTAASLLTLRHYLSLGPWWLILVLAGAACLATAVALRRWLEAGPGGERLGFTADPLFENRRAAATAQTVATLVAMSPDPRVASEGSFEGGGGRSGGGGASGGA